MSATQKLEPEKVKINQKKNILGCHLMDLDQVLGSILQYKKVAANQDLLCKCESLILINEQF